jgi:hypothetical protein
MVEEAVMVHFKRILFELKDEENYAYLSQDT